MKVYVRTFMGGRIEVRSGKSLEREKLRLMNEYLLSRDDFFDFLDRNYCASDFYDTRPTEEEIEDNFRAYCETQAEYDTFGQYKEVIVDENYEEEEENGEKVPF